jgi:hypothetical protein
MTIQEPRLKQRYDRTLSVLADCRPEKASICALLGAWQWFSLTDGEASDEAREAVRLLISDELRVALRNWYGEFGNEMNPHALEMREKLSAMIGEKLG